MWVGWLVGIGVVLGLAYLWQGRGPPAPSAPEEEGPVVDAEAWKVHLRQRGEGEDGWSVTADHAAHLPGPGVTRLRKVRLVLERADKPPVTADARRGRVTDERGAITLEGDVVLVDPRGYRLTTQRLRYYPDEDRATTERPVHIRTDFGEARGVGATAWTRERVVRIHERPHTQFDKVPRNAGQSPSQP
jgi:LPS export ABC transporter protein LptC